MASRWQFRVQVRPATSSPAGSLGDGCGADARTYARRKPEASDLYRVVEEEIETFLAAAASGERPAPRFVAPELRAFLRCGILSSCTASCASTATAVVSTASSPSRARVAASAPPAAAAAKTRRQARRAGKCAVTSRPPNVSQRANARRPPASSTMSRAIARPRP